MISKSLVLRPRDFNLAFSVQISPLSLRCSSVTQNAWLDFPQHAIDFALIWLVVIDDRKRIRWELVDWPDPRSGLWLANRSEFAHIAFVLFHFHSVFDLWNTTTNCRLHIPKLIEHHHILSVNSLDLLLAHSVIERYLSWIQLLSAHHHRVLSCLQECLLLLIQFLNLLRAQIEIRVGS